jgi:hypothetical protein
MPRLKAVNFYEGHVVTQKHWNSSNDKIERVLVLIFAGDFFGFANDLESAVWQPGASFDIIVQEQQLSE